MTVTFYVTVSAVGTISLFFASLDIQLCGRAGGEFRNQVCWVGARGTSRGRISESVMKGLFRFEYEMSGTSARKICMCAHVTCIPQHRVSRGVAEENPTWESTRASICQGTFSKYSSI